MHKDKNLISKKLKVKMLINNTGEVYSPCIVSVNLELEMEKEESIYKAVEEWFKQNTIFEIEVIN